MNGHEENAAVCGRSSDTAARIIAYFGPYLFWGTVSVVVGGIFLLG